MSPYVCSNIPEVWCRDFFVPKAAGVFALSRGVGIGLKTGVICLPILSCAVLHCSFDQMLSAEEEAVANAMLRQLDYEEQYLKQLQSGMTVNKVLSSSDG